MSGGWWCCCQDCWNWGDDFNRTIGTDIGGDWDETNGVGDWEIAAWSDVDHILYEPNTANAKVFSTQAVPSDSAGEMSVAVDIFTNLTAFTTGDEFSLFASCVSSNTSSAYIEAKFTKLSDALKWNVEILSGSTSIDSVDMFSSDTTGLTIHANLCVDSDGEVRASITSSGSEPAWGNVGSALSGRYHGLGHNNISTGGRFDNYEVTELRRSGTICDYCWCPCLDYVPDKTLVATFTDAINRSACLDGDTIDITWTWHSGTPSWDGTGINIDTDSFTLNLYCADGADSQDNSHPGKNFTLKVNGGGTSQSCCRSGCEMIPLSTSTCDPLNLIFGPFSMARTDLVCDACYPPDPFGSLGTPASGEYYIVITDKA